MPRAGEVRQGWKGPLNVVAAHVGLAGAGPAKWWGWDPGPQCAGVAGGGGVAGCNAGVAAPSGNASLSHSRVRKPNLHKVTHVARSHSKKAGEQRLNQPCLPPKCTHASATAPEGAVTKAPGHGAGCSALGAPGCLGVEPPSTGINPVSTGPELEGDITLSH